MGARKARQTSPPARLDIPSIAQEARNAAAGRPSKYEAKYCAEILEYFSPDKALTVLEAGATGPVLAQFPLLSGFAWKIGVCRDTLHEWTRQYPEFSDAYARAREAQEVILVTAGLRGAYNASFAGLTAKNILGWRDKQDTEHTLKPRDAIADLMAAISEGARMKPPGAE